MNFGRGETLSHFTTCQVVTRINQLHYPWHSDLQVRCKRLWSTWSPTASVWRFCRLSRGAGMLHFEFFRLARNGWFPFGWAFLVICREISSEYYWLFRIKSLDLACSCIDLNLSSISCLPSTCIFSRGSKHSRPLLYASDCRHLRRTAGGLDWFDLFPPAPIECDKGA